MVRLGDARSEWEDFGKWVTGNGEGIVATMLAVKGMWKGIRSRISSKGRRSEEGLSMECVQANGRQASMELTSLIQSCILYPRGQETLPVMSQLSGRKQEETNIHFTAVFLLHLVKRQVNMHLVPRKQMTWSQVNFRSYTEAIFNS